MRWKVLIWVARLRRAILPPARCAGDIIIIWVARLRRAILPPARCAGDSFIFYKLESFNLGRAAAPRDTSSSALRWKYFYF